MKHDNTISKTFQILAEIFQQNSGGLLGWPHMPLFQTSTVAHQTFNAKLSTRQLSSKE